MARPFRLLWADDEIELLRPHILYLEERGYEVTGVHSGEDALHMLSEGGFDLLLLDERMPGIDGLAVLERLKVIMPEVPVVMVTQQEDEGLMEEVIGRSIADFLTKPVNPSQVLSVCKRVLESGRIREETITRDYTQEFARLSDRLAGAHLAPAEWGDLAEALAFWSIQLDETGQDDLAESLGTLLREADGVFARQVAEQYGDWVGDGRGWQERMLAALEETVDRGYGPPGSSDGFPPLPGLSGGCPLFVTDVLGRALIPLLSVTDRAVLIVLDCLRLDQWMVFEPLLTDGLKVERIPVFSLLPSASPYARNALLSGRYPDEIASAYPDLWYGDLEEGDEGLNRHEPDMLAEALEAAGEFTGGARLALFERVRLPAEGEAVARRLREGVPAGLSVVVFNFLDLLVHDQVESAVLQELAPDPAAFRALAREWFRHSPLPGVIEKVAATGTPILLATDHGSVQVTRGVEVKADSTASRGLRYKVGRNLNSDSRWTHRIEEMQSWRLPPRGLTFNCLLAREDAFLVFSADQGPYRRRFNGSFQHGGISISEMVLPLARITSPRS